MGRKNQSVRAPSEFTVWNRRVKPERRKKIGRNRKLLYQEERHIGAPPGKLRRRRSSAAWAKEGKDCFQIESRCERQLVGSARAQRLSKIQIGKKAPVRMGTGRCSRKGLDRRKKNAAGDIIGATKKTGGQIRRVSCLPEGRTREQLEGSSPRPTSLLK